MTFDEIVKAVKHFRFWGLAKISYPITPKSIFRLTDKACSLSQIVIDKFKRQFADKDLKTVMIAMFGQGPTTL